MAEVYDLNQLDPTNFEHLVNVLALNVLGLGHTGFGPGSDGGRDGYFEGEAPYPSDSERWRGVWYIQSKFHKPHLSTNPQKWLLDRIEEEIADFAKPGSRRQWPNNWIIATNIDPSGSPMTGAFDKARIMVQKANGKLKNRFHIWGGSKIDGLLTLYPNIARDYLQHITPGHVIAALLEGRADASAILRHLLIRQFEAQQFTRLEQAGSANDARPGIHRLFIDLPFRAEGYTVDGTVSFYLAKASAWCQKLDLKQPDTGPWKWWRRHPARARVWFVRGGPGQGKSTLGQYFCQIQRACFILGDSTFQILQRQRNLAHEIKAAAEPAGLWPLSPRIPVSIELKDFAQWFGQRGEGHARGLLTYLAQRIASGVEQDVLAGTLKTLLKTRRWFFLFDGLDEVPHDVKDAVAKEVINLIDDIAVEVNADVVFLCTSRPQGYSGEFSALDGPTIDLIPLSAAQALACAQPLVELSRSEDEAKKALAILTTALQSESVRELMTTPLQAHIMAVVVRDGGRPPERRWQLYSNFYQVIQRREANRDLPDRRLAVLLRQDKLLLKRLHDRLGFILHARAETSQGAQTNLKRAEFLELVTTTVQSMKDEQIDETVSALMEATTDRLVLVSTPDDGNHVRFDIRPLQEFFAAEFLYESVSADELRARLEIIAGDSHWREVMHFLLSALVENSRHIELVVAVDVLERLNEGDEESSTRLLKRRLCRGAILAAKLLQEGVLEQDKRIRQQFRICLEPITSLVAREATRPLALVNQASSSSWLSNFLADKLIEASFSENVGASRTLILSMPADHPRIQEVRRRLMDAPSDYLSYLIVELAPSRFIDFGEVGPISDWFLGVVVEILLGPRWLQLSHRALRSSIFWITAAPEKVQKHASACGLLENETKLLQAIMFEYRSIYQAAQAAPIGAHVDYGIVKIFHGPVGVWESAEFFGPMRSEKGFIGLLMRIVNAGRTRNVYEFRGILRDVHEESKLLTVLPQSMMCLVLGGSWGEGSDRVDYLLSLGDDRLFEVMTSNALKGSAISIQLEGNFELTKWKQLLEDYPRLAVGLWSGLARERAVLDSEEVASSIVSLLIENHYLLSGAVGRWGKLLKRRSKEANELRGAILAYARTHLEPGLEDTGWGERLDTFPLRLPEEAALLPHLVNRIVGLTSNTQIGQRLKRVGKLISEFSPKPSDLVKVAEDMELEPSARAGAVIMYLLHPSTVKAGGLEEDRGISALLSDLWVPGVGTWYPSAVRECLSLLASEEQPIARRILGCLLDRARGDLFGSQELEHILDAWREKSHGPVQRSQVERRWLALS
jgi:hypothetical protein